MSAPRAGFRIGRLAVTWRDLWTGRRGLEVVWNHRAFLHRGF